MAAESAHRIAEVLNHEPSLTSPANGATEVPDGSVVFEGVSFKYSASAEENALSDIDLRIESGSTLGIVGGTGSSKTSLIQLICRIYDVSEGSVKVGGRDVRDYDLSALRDAVSVVLQKNVLFSGTIKDNMRWATRTPPTNRSSMRASSRRPTSSSSSCPAATTTSSPAAAPTCRAARSSACASPAPC